MQLTGGRVSVSRKGRAGVRERLTRLRVGLWDLDVRIGRLPRVIEAMNGAQGAFVFFEVQAAIPAGLVSRPERLAVWAENKCRRRLKPRERRKLKNHIIGDDFFERAEVIRKALRIQYLVGITANMIATGDGSSIEWNNFSANRGKVILTAAYKLRDIAQAAQRPFEVFVAELVVGQLLVAINEPLEFHDDRGCLFDECNRLGSLIRSLRNPNIEPVCLKLIRPKYRAAASALMHALRTYRG